MEERRNGVRGSRKSIKTEERDLTQSFVMEGFEMMDHPCGGPLLSCKAAEVPTCESTD